MKTLIGAFLTLCLIAGGAFAKEAEKEKDTMGAGKSFRYEPNNGKSPAFYEEGADITINYQWQLSTLLGEPILKCQAAWQPVAVWVKRSSNSEAAYIKTKDLPPKVAASIRLVDLTVTTLTNLGASGFVGVVFDCNVGIPAAAGKEFSYNLPTSPDWHEALGNKSFLSKDENVKENKAKFKEMLTAAPSGLDAYFDYKVSKAQFDLSGVRDWLAEEEEKALAKKAKGPKAKAANLDKERAALAGMKEANATERTKSTAATAQAKTDLVAKEQQYKEKIAALERARQVPEGFVTVPAGCFQMGDAAGGRSGDEKPVHEVCLSAFHIGKYEITQAQWQQVMGKNPSKFSGCANCPVEQVSWNDVQQFIQKLSQQTGMKFRLPTEAEWEYACKAGGNYKYCGSNNIDSVAWYKENKTRPVGQKQANAWGIYDMSGNVREWVSDWYGSYNSDSHRDPQGPSSGSERVFRGSCWGIRWDWVHATIRCRQSPDDRNAGLGFRLVSPVQ